MLWGPFRWWTSVPQWSRRWVWRCNTSTPWSRRSLWVLINLVARTRGGATLEVQLTGGASLSISATILTVANLLTQVLQEEVLRGFGPFLSLGWGWCVPLWRCASPCRVPVEWQVFYLQSGPQGCGV